MRRLARSQPLACRLRHHVLRGFTLIELMVVMAIVAMLAVVGAQRLREAYNDTQAKAAADNITVVGQSVQAYIGANSGTFGAAPQDLTIAQLQAANVLPPTFVGTTPWNSGYSIRIRRTPGGPPFQYEALVVTTTPWFINGGTARIDLVGAAVRKIGGAGGMTYDATGPVGNGGGWGPLPVANYPAANVAGQLAYFVSQATNPNDNIYLRRDGLYPMTGALQMGSQNITGAGSIAAASDITSGGNVGGATMTSTNTIVAGGQVTASAVTAAGIVTGGTLTSNGDINIAANGTLQSSGRMSIQTGEDLYLQPAANASGSRTVFGGNGGTGNATINGTATVANDILLNGLATRSNAPSTTSVKALLPDLVEVGNYLINANGQTVPVPTCDSGGTPNTFILPHVATGTAVGGKWGASIRMLPAAGGVWTVEALDANLNALPNANTPNFAAIVRVFCAY
jgi:prepilin-type N-terminal cleavage/methylation domain-containing protein